MRKKVIQKAGTITGRWQTSTPNKANGPASADEGVLREMLSDEDRKAESNLILAAHMERADCAYKEPNHVVVPADGEYKDSLVWVCTKCWPGTNEVLTLGRNMRLTPRCDVCGCESKNKDDLNAIWKSWIVRVLRRHWEEHKA